jgi:hypothetical protein
MFAIQISGKESGLTFVLNQRFATKKDAEVVLDRIKAANSASYITRSIITV